MRALLIGNFGVGNFGDEVLKEYFTKTFQSLEWTVVTNEWKMKSEELRTGNNSPFAIRHSQFVPRLPFGLRSLFTPWWRTLGAMRRCDIVVFGGGTLFTDIESPKACLLWWWHAFWARMFGKPIVMAFQGVGPFRTGIGKRCARWTVKQAAHVSIRDEASKKRVDAWREGVILTFDPAIMFFEDYMGTVRHGGKTLIIIPRENSNEAFFLRAKILMKSGRFTGARVLSFKPDDHQERVVCEKMCAELGMERPLIVPIRSVMDLETALADVSLIVTQRYHGAVAALATRTPFETVPQNDGDKLASASTRLHRDDCARLAREGEQALRGFLANIAV